MPEEKTVPTKLTRHHGIAAIFMVLWPMKGNYKTYRSSHRLYREIDESEILVFSDVLDLFYTICTFCF